MSTSRFLRLSVANPLRQTSNYLPHLRSSQFRRSYSTPTASNVASLPHRHLLRLSGPDTQKFLHSLTTANIQTFSGSILHTAFLSPQGRVLFDTFIYPRGNDEYLLETDRPVELLQHLKRYKMRSKFTMEAVKDISVRVSWDSTASESAFADPRVPGFGVREIIDAPAMEDQNALRDYKIRRILYGLPEGAEEIIPGSALPMESNFDLSTGGIDFRKGCYVGQELTIRTKHTGVVRKRIVPVQVYKEGEEVPGELTFADRDFGAVEVGCNIKKVDGKGRAVGRWLTGVGNLGLALVRLEGMTDVKLPNDEQAALPGWQGEEFALQDTDIRVKAFVTERMRNYIDGGH
ncbi:hypothetical protein BZA77DRAFT_314288 [Pyronema omphalodes]|nr:hypothetical protein BZA77DRAFT_314288 [Pyronema omphalodes]